MNVRDVWLRIGHKKLSRQWLDQHPGALQGLLTASPRPHVTCLCQGEPGIPLYVAKKKEFYLARMPGSGARHAPYCPSYELPLTHCGLGDYEKRLIVENADGTLTVKLAVAMGIASDTQTHKLLTPSQQRHQPATRGIHLLGLVHLLWERAALNRWFPKMKGKRGYWTVYKYVRDAAQTINVPPSLLIEHLYVPEPFNRHRIDDRVAAQDKLIDRLLTDSHGRPQRMLVFGQVKTFKESPFGVGVVLKHAPQLIFWFSQKGAEQLSTSYLAGQDPITYDCQHPLLWVMMSVNRSASGQLRVAEVAAMHTNEWFIPVDTPHDLRVANALIDSDRQFIKPLRYDAKRSQVFPDFILVDVSRATVPLEIYGYSHDAVFEENKLNAIVRYKKNAVRHWHWDVSQTTQLPPFPQPDLR